MKQILLLGCIIGFFTINTAQAVCVNNQTSFNMYYEIQNKNTGCQVPKERFHSGMLSPKQKRCHAHTQADGDDWRIYRKDIIKVYKVDLTTNKRELACHSQVDGIMNTLDVDYTASMWWCIDDSDKED